MDTVLPAESHSAFDDAQAILTASALVALGYGFLAQAKLLTGGTAGVALLLARVTPFSFGQLFVALNLPFFWLGVRRMGWRFTVKTFVAIALVSLATDHLPAVLHLDRLHPLYGAVMGGVLVGVGLLVLFRHHACLGGLNILSIHLQERHGVRAGAFQMVVDALVVLASLFVAPLSTIALSVVGAVALNLVLAVNHRPGRYLGT
ncbi:MULTISPECIES: YitT family protein [unclassified Anaeromyxobacter]|uniref:YitT family protein n=1 Tax=unclassified Anaeromyxobacter TaxID=2620896 RepID=UPI001F5AEB72|nr:MULTISPECIES: YitT family protein [unclassified Anaeromyxobacter]